MHLPLPHKHVYVCVCMEVLFVYMCAHAGQPGLCVSTYISDCLWTMRA